MTDIACEPGEHTFDIDAEREKIVTDPKDKLIIGCRANNEDLPFLD